MYSIARKVVIFIEGHLYVIRMRFLDGRSICHHMSGTGWLVPNIRGYVNIAGIYRDVTSDSPVVHRARLVCDTRDRIPVGRLVSRHSHHCRGLSRDPWRLDERGFGHVLEYCRLDTRVKSVQKYCFHRSFREKIPFMTALSQSLRAKSSSSDPSSCGKCSISSTAECSISSVACDIKIFH